MTIPKSLHTVTVLVNVARVIQRVTDETNSSAVQSARLALGYGDTPDTYDLAAKAVKAMGQGK